MKPTTSMFATAEDYKKAVVEHRLRELQSLGAGDADCAECLGMNVPSIEICKKCIADTPAFTELVWRLMQRADQTPNAALTERGDQ